MRKPDRLEVRVGDRLASLVHGDVCDVDVSSFKPSLVIGSPPYTMKGNRYDGSGNMRPAEWLAFMRQVTFRMLQCSSGFVVWIVNGPVKNGEYIPVVEQLIAGMQAADVCCERPLIWHKNAPPNRRDWFSNDWEYIVAFRKPGPRPYFDPKGIGAAPKYAAGGHFRQRGSDGKRRRGGDYPTNPIVNARDVIRAIVGGGHMGSKLACENEAPFPESLIKPIIQCCTKPGDVVLDPFCGSGTTLKVSMSIGRDAVGIDCRKSQIALTKKRIMEEVDGFSR